MNANHVPAAGDDPAAALAEAQAAREVCDYVGAERIARLVLAVDLAPLVNSAALRIVGRSRVDRGDFAAAVRPLRRALVLSGDVDSPERVHVLHDLFCAELLRGNVGAAHVYLGRADRLRDREYGKAIELDADRAWMNVQAGEWAQAESIGAALVEQAAPGMARAVVTAHLAVAQAARGEGAGYTRLREVIEDGEGGCAAWPAYGAAWAASLLGRVREAQRLASVARRDAARTGDEYTRRSAADLLRRL